MNDTGNCDVGAVVTDEIDDDVEGEARDVDVVGDADILCSSIRQAGGNTASTIPFRAKAVAMRQVAIGTAVAM